MSGEQARQEAIGAIDDLVSLVIADKPITEAALAAVVDAIAHHVLDTFDTKREAQRLAEQLFVAAIASGKTPGQALALATESLKLLGVHPEI